MKFCSHVDVVKKNKSAWCCFGDVACVGKEAELPSSFCQLLSRFDRQGGVSDR